jgi:WD40 repeat protein
MKRVSLVLSVLLAPALPLWAAEADYFPAVAKLIEDRCIDCHAADDPDGKFVMETHADLLKGGESGAAFEAGKSAQSLLVKYLRGEVEKDGKRKFMPPGKRDKLTVEEIEVFTKWIDAGAKPPQRAMGPKTVTVPKVVPKIAPKVAVSSLAYSSAARLLAAGRYGVVEVIDPRSQAVVKRIEGHEGNVNGIAWSADGTQLFAASGENSISGQVKQWAMPEAKLVRTFKGHRDTIYSVALSPDGRVLATGSYDQKIKLWNVADGAELRTLSGHNGAVFGLAFRPDGRLLASASADRTVKLWEVASGERRDTLSQPQKEQVAVAWSSDGKRLAAAGMDNRIRVWAVSPDARETTNPLAIARFAHEQPILRLAWNPDGSTLMSSAQDGTIRVWEAAEVKERIALEKQPDWPTALAFAGDLLVVGRGDGGVAFFDAKTGRIVQPAKSGAFVPCDGDFAVAQTVAMTSRDECGVEDGDTIPCQATVAEPKKAPPKPAITRLSPRGIQRGGQADVALEGKSLMVVTSVRCVDPRVDVFTGTPADGRVPLIVRTPADLPRGSYDFIAVGTDGKEIGRSALRIGNLAVRDFPGVHPGEAVSLPTTVWGGLEKAGESDRYEFLAKAGQTIVLDATSKGVGGKADMVLQLTDARGAVLASSNAFNGEDAPFIAQKIPASGTYVAVLKDLQMTGGPEHFYTLTIGQLPYVVGAHPAVVAPNVETSVELIGYNLSADAAARRVKVKAPGSGTVALTLDAERFFSRVRMPLAVSDLPNQVESGGNHTPEKAQSLPLPVSMNGRLRTPQQADFFRFTAKKGTTYAIETEAARRGSPADTKLAVLSVDGNPVPRLLIEAVRDSAINFRPIDSVSPDVRVENWREMELNEFMWTGGEINKIFRMPEGPDSGFQYYANGGKRISYFNTTATAHALDELCYIVDVHPPGTTPVESGSLIGWSSARRRRITR